MDKELNKKHWSETTSVSEILQEEGSEEWYEGIEAAKAGLAVTDSPYGLATISGSAWFKGFNSYNDGK